MFVASLDLTMLLENFQDVTSQMEVERYGYHMSVAMGTNKTSFLVHITKGESKIASMIKTPEYTVPQLVKNIVLPREDKIHIFKPPCVIYTNRQY